MTQTTDAATSSILADILGMLERRERTADRAYREARTADDRAERQNSPISDVRKRARLNLHRASARWTEAQESLVEARKLAQS